MTEMFKYRHLLLLFIFLIFFTALVQAQHQVTVTGKVTDNTGQPMEGATIQVKGQATTTISDRDGNFKVTIPAQNAVLLVTSVGYDDQQVAVGKQTQLTVSMKASANSMNEIVVIGYGTAKRKDVTGAVSSMSGKGIEEKPVTRIDQAMIGQLAGVQVQQQTVCPARG